MSSFLHHEGWFVIKPTNGVVCYIVTSQCPPRAGPICRMMPSRWRLLVNAIRFFFATPITSAIWAVVIFGFFSIILTTFSAAPESVIGVVLVTFLVMCCSTISLFTKVLFGIVLVTFLVTFLVMFPRGIVTKTPPELVSKTGMFLLGNHRAKSVYILPFASPLFVAEFNCIAIVFDSSNAHSET